MTDKDTTPAPVPAVADRIASFCGFFGTGKGAAVLLLLSAIAFNAVFLWPEVAVSTYSLNDEVLHLAAAQGAGSALRLNLDPTDFWLDTIGLGFPFFQYYQHLPHVILAVLGQAASPVLPLARLLDFSRYLLLVLFPLPVFYAMRRFDLGYLAAGVSALAASLLSTSGLYGIEYGSYVWSGFGLYTQLFAMFFLPPALAEIYRTVRKEGTFFLPVLLSAIVILSNLMYGYILILSAALIIILIPDAAEICSRIRRLAVFYVLTFLATAYFFIPFLAGSAYLNRSIWEDPFKYSSYGAAAVLQNLFSGNLFDYGRLPVLTVLFLIAAAAVVSQWKKEQHRFLLLVTLAWLLIYFGQPAWGNLVSLLPFSSDLHFHRFIGGFQLGAVMVTGAGLPVVWNWLKKGTLDHSRVPAPLVAVLLLLLVLSPVFLERVQSYDRNAQWKTATGDALDAKSGELRQIRATLAGLPPGRVYAGLYTDFGNYPYYKIGDVPLYALMPQWGTDSFGYAYTAFPLSTDVRLLFNNTRPEQYNLFNIRYVLLHNTWTAPYYYTKIRQFEDYTLYQVPTTGYFDLVDVPAVFYGNTTAFYYPNAAWLESDLVQQKQHPIVVIGDKPEDSAGLPVFSYDEVDSANLSGLSRVQPAAGEILGETVGTNEYRARFSAGRDCYLMLKTNYAPGWEVMLDGNRTAAVMVSPGYVAVRTGPGTHEAVFTYRPPWFRFPLLVLGVLVLAVLGCCTPGMRKYLRNRKRDHADNS